MTSDDILSTRSAVLVASIQAHRDAMAQADRVYAEDGPGVGVVTLGVRFEGRTVETHTYDTRYASAADLQRYAKALERKLSQLQRRHLKIVG